MRQIARVREEPRLLPAGLGRLQAEHIGREQIRRTRGPAVAVTAVAALDAGLRERGQVGVERPLHERELNVAI